MSANRLKLLLAIFILVVAALLWFPGHARQEAFRGAVEQADRDVAAARAAADAAAASAAKAQDAARDLQNRLPGSS